MSLIRPGAGYHKTREGNILKITDMTDEHLFRAIRYASEHQDLEYWAVKILEFKKEQSRRDSLIDIRDVNRLSLVIMEDENVDV